MLEITSLINKLYLLININDKSYTKLSSYRVYEYNIKY